MEKLLDQLRSGNHGAEVLAGQHRLVLVEGETGSGKTFLADRLAACWAREASNSTAKESKPLAKLLIHLDCELMDGTLASAVQIQLYGKNFKNYLSPDKTILPETERELWHMFEAYQEETVFLLDNYRGGPEPWLFDDDWSEHQAPKKEQPGQTKTGPTTASAKNDELSKLLKGLILPKARIVLLSHCRNVQPNCAFEAPKHPKLNKHFVLFGLSNLDSAQGLVLKYHQLTKRPLKVFRELLLQMGSKLEAGPSEPDQFPPLDSPERERMTNFCRSDPENAEFEENESFVKRLRRISTQNPLYLTYFCCMADMQMGVDLQNSAATLEHMMISLKLKIIERESALRPVVNRAYTQLIEIASINANRRRVLTDLELNNGEKPNATSMSIIVKLGLIRPIQNLVQLKQAAQVELGESPENLNLYRFRNTIIQDYLTSKSLELNTRDEISKFFQMLGNNEAMPKALWSRQLAQIISFYLHVRQMDAESVAVKTVIGKVVEGCLSEEQGKPAALTNKLDKSLELTKTRGGVANLRREEQLVLQRLMRGLRRPASVATDATFRSVFESAYAIASSRNDPAMLHQLLKCLPPCLKIGFQQGPTNDRCLRGLSQLLRHQVDQNSQKVKRENMSSGALFPAVLQQVICPKNPERITNKALRLLEFVGKQLNTTQLSTIELRLDQWACLSNWQGLEEFASALGRPMPREKSRALILHWQARTLDQLLRFIQTLFAHSTSPSASNGVARLVCVDESVRPRPKQLPNKLEPPKPYSTMEVQKFSTGTDYEPHSDSLDEDESQSSEDEGQGHFSPLLKSRLLLSCLGSLGVRKCFSSCTTEFGDREIKGIESQQENREQINSEIGRNEATGDESPVQNEITEKPTEEKKRPRKKKKHEQLAGNVAKSTRAAFENTESLSHFAFTGCLNAAFVNAVIRNLPRFLFTLDLSGCTLSYIGSRSLVRLVRASNLLQQLKLNYVRMNSLTLTSFLNDALPAKAHQVPTATGTAESKHSKRTDASAGRKEIHGIAELCLEGFRSLDKVASYGLAQAISQTLRLQRLNLRNTRLSTEACEDLIRMMQGNNGLRELLVTGSMISQRGRQLLWPYRSYRQIEIHGLSEDGSSEFSHSETNATTVTGDAKANGDVRRRSFLSIDCIEEEF